jgi:hypothetical protein
MKDPNKLHHIFDNPDHHLAPLVQQYGSEKAAYRAIKDAVSKAYRDGNLIANAHGSYKQAFEIGGLSVTVVGRIVKGQVRIGTAWGPVPSGWSVELPHLRRASKRRVDSVFEPPWKHEDNDA